MSAAVQIIQSAKQAATVLQPERLQLLEMLAEPDSASGLARKLGLPRQKVNYHLQQLERDGFLDLVEERRKGNCVERLLRASAKSYFISPTALGALGSSPVEVRDRASCAYLVATAARAIRDVSSLRIRADHAKKRLATLTLETEIRFASAATRAGFTEELANELVRLTAKYQDSETAGGRSFRFIVAGYPALMKQDEDTLKPVRME